MESLFHYIIEAGLVLSACALCFLSVKLRARFPKKSPFAAPFAILALSTLLLSLAFSADMALDYFNVDVANLPSLLNFAFLAALTFGVYKIYTSTRTSTVELEKTKTELSLTQKKLFESQRLAAIGELAGMIGHDLRNPLTGIAGATYYLKRKCAGAAGQSEREALGTIEECIKRSDKIINDLKEYSTDLRLELVGTTPKRLVDDALLSVDIPENIHILNEARDEPALQVDLDMIRRVLVNLIKNAFDAMPEGGKLTLRSENKKSKVLISVSDSGAGIPAGELDKIWRPLFTTKAKGMGFGLPICKRLVEAHGGIIDVHSVENEGSKFTVTLPVEITNKENPDESWLNLPEQIHNGPF